MEKMKITQVFYNDDADELDLVINVDKPQPAVSHLVEDDFYLRVNPETDQVVGATIFNASLYFGQLARAFALKAFDDPNVRFFLERRVESFALEKA
ncbi:MAG: hypothetical protein HY327_08940 [Chloroflexi bacterium]|nr:hypothetical protein [Chloroflexota bacterium]